MYALWTKLTWFEEVLLGEASEVIDYLRTNFYSRMQQIHSMLSERAQHLKRNSFQEIPNESFPFRILPKSDSSFDTLCDYAGFILYSYHKKSDFTLNGQQYHRGDILLKDINNIPKSSTILQSDLRNQQVYNNLYKSLLNGYFEGLSYKYFVGLGIIYEQNKWKFDAFIIGSEPMRSLFTLEEHHLLEMCILTWTKNKNDEKSIRNNAREMLEEQLNYTKELLKTQQPDMENLWTSKEVNLAIKVFEHEIQDEIDTLFHTTPTFNTFSNLHDQVQSNNANKLQLYVEIFEHRRLALKTQPSEPLLCQIWKQLKMVETWLHNDDFHSLINFLQLNTFTSIESLFSITIPPFLDHLGICPESDPFDPTLDYIGLLIYLYNDQDQFTLYGHNCQLGQILICQIKNIKDFAQAPKYHQTSYAPLFIHEYLYQLYLNKQPDELFQGIGFVYEQGKWKFDVITYAGRHGIHSTYDIRGDNRMAASINEQHCIDLALSTLYINNKWLTKLACMYAIDELEAMGRASFREAIEKIEELSQTKKTALIHFNNTCYPALKNFIEQYKPEAGVKRLISHDDVNTERSSLQESRACITNLKNDEKLNNSEPNVDPKQSLKFDPSVDNASRSSLPIQLDLTPQEPNTSLERNPLRTSKRPNTFRTIEGFLSRRRSKSRDSSSTSHTPPQPANPTDASEQNETSPINPPKSDRSDSLSLKTNETITLYQLWRELCVAEQQILHNSTLNDFLAYLTKKDYLNSCESVRFIPPTDEEEEYQLMAKIKIDSQLEFLDKLFLLKKSKLSTNQEKKQFEDLFEIFKKHYIKQIERAKKSSKFNSK